jgi:hypothetical protein
VEPGLLQQLCEKTFTEDIAIKRRKDFAFIGLNFSKANLFQNKMKRKNFGVEYLPQKKSDHYDRSSLSVCRNFIFRSAK